MRESGDPELEAELEATRRRAVAELRGVGGGSAVPNEELLRELATVISDPGSVLPRHYYRPGERETQEQWAARAVLASLPRLGATVDTGPSPAEEALSDLAEDMEIHAEEVGRGEGDVNAGDLVRYVARLRAALASPAPAPQGEEGQP